MKNLALLIVCYFVFVSCATLHQKTPMTAFVVKNTSDKAISFTTSIMKQSQTMGRHVVTRAFTVLPQDSILARKVYFAKDGKAPQNWFLSFDILPVEGVTLNDPHLAENWQKSSQDGLPIYTFTLNK